MYKLCIMAEEFTSILVKERRKKKSPIPLHTFPHSNHPQGALLAKKCFRF